MDRRRVLQALASFGALTLCPEVRAGTRFVVIANPRNPIRSVGPGEIEAIFTTRKLSWSTGARVLPFNFPAQTALRSAFDREALHLEPSEVARFWIDRRVRGGNPPPRQIPDVKTMLRVVSAVETAVGYVLREDLDGTVRVVAEV